MLKLETNYLLSQFNSLQPCPSEPCCPTCSLPWSGKSTSGRGRFCLVCSNFTIQRPETLDSLELLAEFKAIMRAALNEYEKRYKMAGIPVVKPDLEVVFKSFDIASDW